jgi:NAD(P)-dependent dehydrogenase (short-subunit alcohol dehydrogenase family)
VAGRVEGKVAFITGAGRGQGRSHAIRLAEEGADIIAVDILRDYDTVAYGMSTEADLAQTVKDVEALDRRIVGPRPTSATPPRSRRPWTTAWRSSGTWTSCAPTRASAPCSPGTK